MGNASGVRAGKKLGRPALNGGWGGWSKGSRLNGSRCVICPLAVVCGIEDVGNVLVAPRHPCLAGCLVLNTRSTHAPPVVQTLVDTVPAGASALMQQSAQPAPELGVDVLAWSLPPEVRVVAVAVGGDGAQEVGELARRREVVDVDERLGRRGALVVTAWRAHHHRDHVIPDSTDDTRRVPYNGECTELALIDSTNYCLLLYYCTISPY